MQNGNGHEEPTGFKAMSQKAETIDRDDEAEREDGQSGSDARSSELDTGQMTELAGEGISDLQQVLIDEVRARPLRALGWAVGLGVVFGFWAAR